MHKGEISMKIAVCDDGKIDIEIISEFMKLYFSDKSYTPDIAIYSSGDALISDFGEGKSYDAVFLDIYMESITGMEAAKSLRESGYTGALIFITATEEYALGGYEVEAAGYIVKPYSYDSLCSVMDRVTEKLNRDAYSIRRRGGIIRVQLNDIMYVESSNSKCMLHTVGGEMYNIYKRLDEIEEELSDRRFLRCHQSYIVNMNYIESADEQFVLTNGDIVYIRNRDIRAIKKKYLEYIG